MYLCKIGPFTLKAHWSALLLSMFGFMVGGAYAVHANVGFLGMIALSLIATLIIAFSIIFHELGHAYAGRKLTDKKHATITLMALGAVCTNAMTEWTSTRNKIIIFAAGPIANFFLFSIGTLLVNALVHLNPHLIYVQSSYTFLGASLIMFMTINIMLGMFNLIPIFPMDGGQIFYNVLQLFMTNLKLVKLITFVASCLSVVAAMLYFHIFDTLTILIFGMLLWQAWQHLMTNQDRY